ncbi:26S proteasome non-ATPase regulatory subunit 10 [Anabrus simplex]|uniref:26S proteasome non-ATPase regulatory subunit 10 n=1 Tax=Anabrus simplex TaxID=316456 RepID=UPI0035A27C66
MDVFVKVPPCFFALVLKALLLIGGVESNPGPSNKDNCELCGACLETSPEEFKAKLSKLEEKLQERENLFEMKIIMSNEKEALLANKEMFYVEREWLMIHKEKRILESGTVYSPDHLKTALCRGKRSAVRDILETGTVSVEHRFEDRKTALLLAAELGHVDVVQYLVADAGACLDVADNAKGRSALHWAACSGHCHVVKYLVNEVKMNASEKTALLETPLHLAAEGGFLDVVRFLVEVGKVNVHDKDFMGMSAAHFAAKHGHLHVIKYLWENCTSFDSTANGWTPLHFACDAGHLDVVVYLVQSGAVDKNAVNAAGYKAVAYASKYNRAIKDFLALP